MQSFKYLICNKQDMAWGMTVNSIGSQIIEPGYEVYPPRHGHPDKFYFEPNKGRILDCYQLLYITEGNGYFYTDPNHFIRIHSGDMFMLKPGVWHSYFPDKKSGWKEYWIGLQGMNIDNRIANNFFDPNQIIYKVGLRDDVVAMFTKAFDVAKEEKSGYQQYLSGIANLIMGIMMYSDKNNNFNNNELQEKINKAKILIRENIGADLKLEEIANQVNMSYSWFRKEFKNYTGLSPANYVQEMKIEKAKYLLTRSNVPIKEISYMLNYDTVSYFSHIFKKRTGYTPQQYRLSSRPNDQIPL